MPAGQLEGIINHLRKVACRGEGDPVDDAEQLERFLSHRDDTAFELLVRRHGPMVLAVCKRILGNEPDAEDAFQATFLVFVGKAASILPRTQVGNWLHGVAHKTALKARAMNSKRRAKEREAVAQNRDDADDRLELLLEVLDAELRALPEKYRAPIILCDLEGISYREAAARLRCPQGTLSGRLTRARALLARRIARRCPSVTPAVLTALLARETSAALPLSLTDWAVRAATVLAAEKPLTEGAVSARVASLAEGVLKMLFLSKVRVVTGGALLVAAVLALGWTCAPEVSAEDPNEPVRRSQATDRPAAAQEAEFIFRGVEKDNSSVSLVVAGTSAPVLRLPVKENLRVLIGGRQVGVDRLPLGARVRIRLDSTDSVIRDIWAKELSAKVTVVKGVDEFAQLDPPSTKEVLRALSDGPRGGHQVPDASWEEVSVVIEPLTRQVDPPRHFPLVGKAELHHCHWKCTVYFSETVKPNDPNKESIKRARAEVVYIDRDYLVQAR